MNLSKKRREESIQKIREIRSYIAKAPQDDNTGTLLTYLSELEKDVKAKKYGLVFEEHREHIDDLLAHNTPVLTEEKDLFLDHGGQMNFLLEGDNLAALQLLLKTHRGKIDLIYIDPPYNTGNKDFIYNDDYVDKTDGFRHSKWISFMKKRLELAQSLLSEGGAIFISINDLEQATLRILCDSVFGEDNFIAVFPRKGSGGRQDSKFFAVVHEYVICYAHSSNKYQSGRESHLSGNYPFFDEQKKKYYKTQLLRKWGDNSRRENRPNLFYPIFYAKDGTIDIEPHNNTDIAIFPMLKKETEGRWRWGKNTMRQNLKAGNVEIKERDGEYIPYEKKYQPDEEQSKPYSTWIDDIDNSSGSALVKSILGDDVFNYPKPVDLIVRLIGIGTQKPVFTVLDFFAGSGTTGQAVLKLNEQDNGARQFILCTNNENGICRDITYERIKRVIDKEQYRASLKYYRIDYIPIDEKLYYEYADELLRHIRELVELENGINFLENDEIAIVLTDEELVTFVDRIGEFRKCKKLYLGHDVLPDGQQNAALKKRKIIINVIPQYYYTES